MPTVLFTTTELISSECPLHKLDLSCKVADNQAKTDIVPFVYALATNDTLKELDISGNAMGDRGMLGLVPSFLPSNLCPPILSPCLRPHHLGRIRWHRSGQGLAD